MAPFMPMFVSGWNWGISLSFCVGSSSRTTPMIFTCTDATHVWVRTNAGVPASPPKAFVPKKAAKFP